MLVVRVECNAWRVVLTRLMLVAESGVKVVVVCGCDELVVVCIYTTCAGDGAG